MQTPLLGGRAAAAAVPEHRSIPAARRPVWRRAGERRAGAERTVQRCGGSSTQPATASSPLARFLRRSACRS